MIPQKPNFVAILKDAEETLQKLGREYTTADIIALAQVMALFYIEETMIRLKGDKFY